VEVAFQEEEEFVRFVTPEMGVYGMAVVGQ
jgi:hypothetical protein